jgi:hypothetical protein
METGHLSLTQESITVGQMSIRYLIDGSATGSMGVFELAVPPSSNVPPPHSHTGNESAYTSWRVCCDTLWTTSHAICVLGIGCSPLAVPSINSAIHTMSLPGRSSF